MAKKHKAPPGLDYDPVTGEDPDVSYGVVEASAGAGLPRRTLEDVLFKRAFPTDKPDRALPWPPPTADRWEILLPRGAPDEFSDPQQLARAFHRNERGAIQHLAAVTTLRHVETDAVPATMRMHEAWSCARQLGVELGAQLEIAVVVVFHVPGRSWGHGIPHSHLILPVRRVRPTGFTTFVMPLINAEEGRAIIDREWKRVRREAGYGE
ncbi:hypothetical protein E2493_16645 [Sphingomonas parva]|uniref:MobA/MobL protein domain-containing protein n=1 Tax=Sphingomonas parva TaxID=2555898 RepID=A0A4Y8ZMB6_9SPHN|nr:hypothetical protein [Sphingomonas parva]TFI57138.1 hypothetical protein E2493_16645 [Sphingomonas parva]